MFPSFKRALKLASLSYVANPKQTNLFPGYCADTFQTDREMRQDASVVDLLTKPPWKLLVFLSRHDSVALGTRYLSSGANRLPRTM